MATAKTTHESPPAGKGGEPTAQTPPATASSAAIDPKTLTPDGVASLLDSAFAEQPGPTKPGEEVQPGKAADVIPHKETAEPQWTADQSAWFELRAKAATPEEIVAVDAQAPEFTPEQRAWIEKQNAEPPKGEKTELPAEVLAQVKAWEEQGGALPAQLQSIVDKRIGRELAKVKELEAEAQNAKAEAARLKTELENAGGPPASVDLDEKALEQLVTASKKFQADARAFIGNYANQEQTALLEKHMKAGGQDEKALRRQLDEVNDWLTQDLPALRQRAQEFKASEAKVTPIVQSRFPTLGKADSEEGKFAAEAARLVPELARRSPAHKLALGVYALGALAWNHLAKSTDGDVIAELKSLLTKHAPLPANGNGHAPNGKKFFLPGKPPPRTPAGGSPASSRVANPHAAAAEAASQELREAPTAANVIKSLNLALRVPAHTE